MEETQQKDAAQVIAELTQTNSELRARIAVLEKQLGLRRRKLRRATSVSELTQMRYATMPWGGAWRDAFGTPETSGVWFIWGRSGSGKTTFVLKLCKELARYGKVVYDSLEEGTRMTMRNAVLRIGMADVARSFTLVNDPIKDLDERISRHKSARIVVIDSFQYAEFSAMGYKDFIARHRNKLLIFISQCEGTSPAGHTAVSAMFSADLKIWVEGYRAISKGRTMGEKGYYTIWPERAGVYWGGKEIKN